MNSLIKPLKGPLWIEETVQPSLNTADQIKGLLSLRLILVCFLWAAVIFSVDLAVPPGIAVAVPYVSLVLIGLWLEHPYYISISVTGATLLTVLGFLNSPEGGEFVVILSNRFIAIAAIWVTGILCFLYKREERKLKRSHEDLEMKVMELRFLKEKFEESAKTDALTELPNRRGMLEKLEYEKFLFKRNKKPFVIIMADIDCFKKINDTYGHDAGDHVLVKVAQIIRRSMRRTDSICRWGGEEFLFLLPETGLQGGITLAEKLRSKIEKEVFRYPPYLISVTLSFGVSVFGEATLDVDDCIKQADENLYKAKQNGRNRVIFPENACEEYFGGVIYNSF